MAVLDILKYPDVRLHTVAERVPVVDDRIRKLVADMAETMYAAPGIGLAATQVNVHERVVVIDLTETHDQLQVFINPEITWSSDTLQSYEEGCLSIPGIYDKVERPDAVTVVAFWWEVSFCSSHSSDPVRCSTGGPRLATTSPPTKARSPFSGESPSPSAPSS